MEAQRKHKYPHAFSYGFFFGITFQIMTRKATKEPLSARPISYLTTGLVMGAFHSYWDWWRRVATEEVLYSENETNFHNMMRSANNVRVGEEEDTQNLVEYLKGTTTRL